MRCALQGAKRTQGRCSVLATKTWVVWAQGGKTIRLTESLICAIQLLV
jgi:hypothetical protein